MPQPQHRRGQIVLTGMPEDFFKENSDPLMLLYKAGMSIPDFAVACVVVTRLSQGSIRVMFFENGDDTLQGYTKFLLFRRKSDADVFCYSRKNSTSAWSSTPP
jgi:hypothetical protein